MNLQPPQGLNRQRVKQILAEIEQGCKHERSIVSRIEALSHYFLGCAYTPNPMIGSADTAEVFTVSLDRFDCVTYIEICFALALASNVDDFVEWLRKIRYERGCVRWDRRNHYMTLWIRNNLREGIIKSVWPQTVPIVTRERLLNIVPRLAARRVRMRCLPKAAAARSGTYLQTGDLIFFASTRRHLDIFHCGIIMRKDENILMRHASRSKGVVVEQELTEFLETNRMAGIIVVRPQESAELNHRTRAAIN
jgi:Protein of unknown function (DUF1460)